MIWMRSSPPACVSQAAASSISRFVDSSLRSVLPSFLYFMPLKSSVMVTVWSGQKRGLEAHAVVSSSGSSPRILASLCCGMLGSQ